MIGLKYKRNDLVITTSWFYNFQPNLFRKLSNQLSDFELTVKYSGSFLLHRLICYFDFGYCLRNAYYFF